MVSCATRDKNCLRSILLESCPAFEALADLSDPHWLGMLASLGGPWGILDAGEASLSAVTRGADRAEVDAAWEAAASSTRPSEWQVAAENPQVRMLARRISEAAEEAARLDAEIAALLAEEATYGCPLTVPGIGPRTASELVFSCNSLVRSNCRFGEHYRRCRERGMCHGEALKATARKRLKVIYAIMRDKVPYSA